MEVDVVEMRVFGHLPCVVCRGLLVWDDMKIVVFVLFMLIVLLEYVVVGCSRDDVNVNNGAVVVF